MVQPSPPASWCQLLVSQSLGVANVALVGLHCLSHLGVFLGVGLHCPTSSLPPREKLCWRGWRWSCALSSRHTLCFGINYPTGAAHLGVLCLRSWGVAGFTLHQTIKLTLVVLVCFLGNSSVWCHVQPALFVMCAFLK